MDALAYLKEAAGVRTVDIRIVEEGVRLAVKDPAWGITRHVDWIELEQAKTNPLMRRIEEMARAIPPGREQHESP